MIKTIDQTGILHVLDDGPQRIVSLVPSITELLYDFGLQEVIVGCTKFCVHPKGFKKTITIVGGTKKVKVDKVIALKPDIILANKEENTKEDIAKLRSCCPVWVSDIPDVKGSYALISAIGEIYNNPYKADEIIKTTKQILNKTNDINFSVAYLIWRAPYMTIGGDTFIHDMLTYCGFENVFGDRLRYPEVTISDIQDKRPDVIFLSSEPFPFKDKHIEELKMKIPNVKVVLVDGEYFSWYGTRILHCPDYKNKLYEQLENI